MRIRISEDESALGGGRALVVFEVPPPSGATIAFWSHGCESYLGPGGSWRRTPHPFPLALRKDGAAVLGRDVVDHLDEDDQLRLEPSWGPAVETVWPFVPRSQPVGDDGRGVWLPQRAAVPGADVGPVAPVRVQPASPVERREEAAPPPPAALPSRRAPRRSLLRLIAPSLLLMVAAVAAAAYFIPQFRDTLSAYVPHEFLCEQLGHYCTELHEPRIAEAALSCASRTQSACDASQACFADYDLRFPHGGPSRARIDTRRRDVGEACARARIEETEHRTFLTCVRENPCGTEACRTRYREATQSAGERDLTNDLHAADRMCLARNQTAFDTYGTCLEANPCQFSACRQAYESAVPERLRRDLSPFEERARNTCQVIEQESGAIVVLNECRARTPACEQERLCFAGYFSTFRNVGRRTSQIEEELRSTRESCRRDTEADRQALLNLQSCAARNQCELGSCRAAFESSVPLVRRILIGRLSDRILENAAGRCEEDRAFTELKSCASREPCGFSACLAAYEGVANAEGRGSRYLQIEALRREAQNACPRTRGTWRLPPGRYRFERRFANAPEAERRARRCFPVELVVTVTPLGEVTWVDREVGRHSEWRGTLTNLERGVIQVAGDGVRAYDGSGAALRVVGQANGPVDQVDLQFGPCGRGSMRLVGPAN